MHAGLVLTHCTLVWVACSAPPASPADAPAAPRDPLITEVLYAVPTYEGDANRDGRRSATGDEFIELVNPFDTPIQLRGYTLTDRNPPDQGQMRFEFPTLTLKPGEVVVVFNGLDARWKGPVGDDRRAPPAPNELFHDAWVLTMHNDSSLTGLANGGDWVLLTAPDGRIVSCLRWGRTAEYPPINDERLVELPETFVGSVQLDPATGRFREHRSLGGRFAALPFSPGLFGPPRQLPPSRAAHPGGQ